MMSKQPFINNVLRLSGLLLILFLFSAPVFSEEQTKKIRGPITITSKMLTADNKAHTALFEHSVVARTQDMTIYSEKMLVYYDDSGNVTKLEAGGGVKLVQGNRVITSQDATYYADGEKVIFTGDPRAVEGENVVTGKIMTYLMNEDRFLVENSKVFLSNKKEQ
jgi:lipopolysaccharide export system protein LptA